MCVEYTLNFALSFPVLVIFYASFVTDLLWQSLGNFSNGVRSTWFFYDQEGQFVRFFLLSFLAWCDSLFAFGLSETFIF